MLLHEPVPAVYQPPDAVPVVREAEEVVHRVILSGSQERRKTLAVIIEVKIAVEPNDMEHLLHSITHHGGQLKKRKFMYASAPGRPARTNA